MQIAICFTHLTRLLRQSITLPLLQMVIGLLVHATLNPVPDTATPFSHQNTSRQFRRRDAARRSLTNQDASLTRAFEPVLLKVRMF